MGKANKGNTKSMGKVTINNNQKAKVKASSKRVVVKNSAPKSKQAVAAKKRVQVAKKEVPIKKSAPKQKGPQIFFNDAQKVKATSGGAKQTGAPKQNNGSKKNGGGSGNKAVLRSANKNSNINSTRPVQRVNLGQGQGGGRTAAAVPVQMPARFGGSRGGIGVSLKTAEAISKDSSHPNRGEVYELLKTFERGWIDAGKFSALLSKLI